MKENTTLGISESFFMESTEDEKNIYDFFWKKIMG